MIKKLPSQKYLKECFLYERETGQLFWRKRPRYHFISDKEFKRWNTCWAGMQAFTANKKDTRRPGSMLYKHGTIDSVMYSAHRVIWKLVKGKEPPAIIDHKDRNGTNNRWKNLRAASYGQNFINRTTPWGVDGVIGIRRRPYKYRPWNARIHRDKKVIDLGWFASKKEAVAVRRIAEKKLYGAFAP